MKVCTAHLVVDSEAEESCDEACLSLEEAHNEGPVCAICLGQIDLPDLAMLPECDHVYCAHCIIHWASLREQGAATCPQCKSGFAEVITYRNLDGTLHDFPVQNSVCLLKRAGWFRLRAEEHIAPLEPAPPPAAEHSWGDEDDDLEAFYFSSAAGRARVILGNRRFGDGGYIVSGRRQARPLPKSKAGGGGGGSRSSAAQPARPHSSTAVDVPARPRAGGEASGPGGSLPSPSPPGLYGSSPSGSGRRARRHARRAAVDGVPVAA